MDLRESVHQIHQCKDVFGKRFYEYFLGKYPDAGKYFSNVNMARQAIVFTMQLTVIEAHHTNGTPTAEQYLRVLGTIHQERGIPLDLYHGFRECLVDQLKEFHGEQWDDDLARQWVQAIDGAVEKMAEGYARRYHV